MSQERSDRLSYPPQVAWMLRRALQDTEGFWGEVAGELHWFSSWDKVFEWNYPNFRWFVGGKTNISYNCLDYNVVKRNRGNRAAILWESPETGQRRVITYNELLYQVRRLASALVALGVKKGDRVTIYMPMVPEAAIAMLATTRIGAIHSVVFGGFGVGALADRVTDAGSKVLLTADLGYRRGKEVKLKDVVDQALANAGSVEKVVVLQRDPAGVTMKQGRDIHWKDAIAMGKGIVTEPCQMESNELAFILHTSGTTAKPKGTVQPHGSYQVYIRAMGKWVYDMKETDVWWSTSDIGWIVGHSYVVYAPLLFGCSTIMYEGVPDHPAPDVWWEIVERHGVTQLWLSPTGIRTVMKYGDEWPRKHDLSSLRLVVSAGEVLNPPVWNWLQKTVLEDRIPVIDHMWQTEGSGPMIGNPYGIAMLPIKPGSATIPLPGIDAEIVDAEGKPIPEGVKGNFVCKRPFPGLTPTLWKDSERYATDYWNKIPGCYYTGDAAFRDADGYFWFVGRYDEVIKIAAHRIGTIEVESTFIKHQSVAEAAVVGIPDAVRGEIAAAFVILKEGYAPSSTLKQELRELVKNSLGPVVVIGDINFVRMLPKTRSGKIMRRLIRAMITEQALGDYSTIEEEASLEEIKRAAEELKHSLESV